MPGLRWKAAALDALKRDYEAAVLPVNDIASAHGTSRGHLMRLAKRHGWQRRQAERLPPAAHAHWNTYRNIQRWHGRAIALDVVAGISVDAEYVAATDGAAASHTQAQAAHLRRPMQTPTAPAAASINAALTNFHAP